MFLEQFGMDVGRFRNTVRIDDEEIAFLEIHGRARKLGLIEHPNGQVPRCETFDLARAAKNQRGHVARVYVLEAPRLVQHSIKNGGVAVLAAALAEISIHTGEDVS